MVDLANSMGVFYNDSLVVNTTLNRWNESLPNSNVTKHIMATMGTSKIPTWTSSLNRTQWYTPPSRYNTTINTTTKVIPKSTTTDNTMPSPIKVDGQVEQVVGILDPVILAQIQTKTIRTPLRILSL